MTRAELIVDKALSQAGYTEDPPNSNRTKYGAWFGFDGVPWCAMFVSWCYHHAGTPLGNIGFKKGMAGCQTAVAHFRRTKEVTEKPRPGDLAFFDWNKDTRFDHVGIVVSVGDHGTFKTIEGNTSMDNQSNGGQVMRRLRKVNGTYTVLFVHPSVLDQPITA